MANHDPEYHRRYRAINRERLKIMAAKYHLENRERKLRLGRERYHRNKERYTNKMRAWRANNIEKCKKTGRIYHLKTRYGISGQEYSEQLKKQRGVCFICRCPETSKLSGKVRQLAVDHCHNAGHQRSLLCFGCNTALGKFRHSIQIVERALDYLKRDVLFNQH